MSKIYTPQEKQKIKSHPIYIKYSGSVPDELRHLVYPDEAKPKGKKKSEPEIVEQVEKTDGDSN